ncbi:ly6/PLAUR domain-containing protein 2-like [Amblyraja radiata]|uniref:ly6/PLAUR domain-containing protein 2-like n=1 Tax=Amblyraja radiata TaxID=386614 RepID=UPI001402786C|nr:ly6/PLAUR domain-containing protein 2-like [Amblyraja radiata]
MKLITGAFITAFCSLFAEALECYNCTNARMATVCTTDRQQCPTNKTMCLTAVKTVGFSQIGLGYITISKKCSFQTECNADASNLVVGGRKVLCCSTDLCNAENAAFCPGLRWPLLAASTTLPWTLLGLTSST